jgi:hypothetical protein
VSNLPEKFQDGGDAGVELAKCAGELHAMIQACDACEGAAALPLTTGLAAAGAECGRCTGCGKSQGLTLSLNPSPGPSLHSGKDRQGMWGCSEMLNALLDGQEQEFVLLQCSALREQLESTNTTLQATSLAPHPSSLTLNLRLPTLPLPLPLIPQDMIVDKTRTDKAIATLPSPALFDEVRKQKQDAEAHAKCTTPC